MPNYYASPSASGGSGTLGDPWDLDTALSQTYSPNDFLYLRGGVYSGFGGASLTDSGTDADNPITIKNYAGEVPRINDGGEITIRGDYWVVDGILFRNYSGFTDAIQIGDYSSHKSDGVVIQNCVFRRLTGRAIIIQYGDGTQILNNEFTEINSGVVDVGKHAIEPVNWYDNLLIDGNTFTDIASDCIQIGGTSIALAGSMTFSNNRCIVTQNAQDNEPWAENAVDIKTCTGPIVIEYNYFSGFRPTDPSTEGHAGGSQGAAVVVHGTDTTASENVTIQYNIFEDCTRGITVNQKGTGQNDNVVVKGNVFRDIYDFAGNAYRPSSSGSTAINISDHTDNLVIESNIICDIEDYVTLDDAGSFVWTGNIIGDGTPSLGGTNTPTSSYTRWYPAATKTGILQDSTDTDETGTINCSGATPVDSSICAEVTDALVSLLEANSKLIAAMFGGFGNDDLVKDQRKAMRRFDEIKEYLKELCE